MAHREHNERVLKSLNAGDVVQFPRGIYSHWGIFEGDDKIIHFGNKDDKGTVVEDNFWDVVGQDKAYNKNDKHVDWSPLPRKEIIERARSLVGKSGNYDVLSENCEHFVNWCRYDKKVSDQADNFIAGLKVAAIVGVATFGIATAVNAFTESAEGKKQSKKEEA